MDLDRLRVFLVVAETGGLRKAARALSMSQAAVSVQVQRLEQEVGCALFHRTGRGVELTDAGARLTGPAQRLLDDAREALETARGERYRGTLVLGVQPGGAGELTRPLLRELRRRLPLVDLRVVPSPLADWTPEPAHGVDATVMRDVWGDGAQVSPLSEEPFLVAVPRRSDLAGATELTAQVVAEAPLVRLSPVARPLREFWTLSTVRDGADGDLRGPGADSPGATHERVALGDGLAVGPELMRRTFAPDPRMDLARLTGYGSSTVGLVSRGGDARPLVQAVHHHAADVARRLGPALLPDLDGR